MVDKNLEESPMIYSAYKVLETTDALSNPPGPLTEISLVKGDSETKSLVLVESRHAPRVGGHRFVTPCHRETSAERTIASDYRFRFASIRNIDDDADVGNGRPSGNDGWNPSPGRGQPQGLLRI